MEGVSLLTAFCAASLRVEARTSFTGPRALGGRRRLGPFLLAPGLGDGSVAGMSARFGRKRAAWKNERHGRQGPHHVGDLSSAFSGRICVGAWVASVRGSRALPRITDGLGAQPGPRRDLKTARSARFGASRAVSRWLPVARPPDSFRARRLPLGRIYRVLSPLQPHPAHFQVGRTSTSLPVHLEGTPRPLTRGKPRKVN
jgi:hypothetical protein